MANRSRIRAGTATPVTRTFYAPDGETATDATGAVTVRVDHVNGTAIVAPGNATSLGSGVYSITIPAQTDPADLLVTWTATVSGYAEKEIDTVSVVGNFFANLADIRALDGLSNATKYPTSLLVTKREEAESLFEQATDHNWTQKYASDTLDGDPTYRRAFMPVDQLYLLNLTRRLALRHENPARLLSVTIDGVAATDLTAFKLYPSGEVERLMSSPGWPRGVQNIVVEYVHGEVAPPPDLRRAWMKYVRHLILDETNRIHDRATAITTPEGTFSIAQATGWLKPTGLPEVDATLNRYGDRTPVIA